MDRLRARAKFTEVLRNVFDFQRNRTASAVLLFVLAILSFGWFVNSSTSVISALGRFVQRWMAVPISGDPAADLRRALSDVAGPAAAFLVALAFMWSNYRENTAERVLHLRPPRTRKGLIVLLSPYNPRQSRIATAQQLGAALDTRSAADLRKDVFDSNWGPIAVAAEYHGKTLKHCFVVCTAGDKGSEPRFGMAQRLLRAFSNPEARFHKVLIPDANDLSRIVSEIARIYELVGGFNLRMRDLIADFTGGTAVMSGGVILVAAEKGIEIEYVRQDHPLTKKDGHPLTPLEIFKQNVLVPFTPKAANEERKLEKLVEE